MEFRWNETNRIKPKHWERKLSQYHFDRHKSHIAWTLGLNPGFGDDRLATNCLSHGTNLIKKRETAGHSIE
jgi:hypothetical protein